MKILVTQPIFIPNEDKLKRNINSIKSFKHILKKYLLMNLEIDIKIGGWAESDDLWDRFIKNVDDNISYKRFDKNYGKSFIINDLSKNIDDYDYMLTLDSDIVFIDNDPIKRLVKLAEKIPTYTNKPFGFLSLNQEESNCHLIDTLDKSFKWGNEVVKWAEDGGGIAGGCLFISKENWKEVGGYREGLKNYDSDDRYFLLDTLKNGMSFGLAESLHVIHPKDDDGEYAKWKLDSVSKNKSICFFSSYSDKPFIDNYIKFYLENLKLHFDDVVLVTNERKIESKEYKFLKKINVSIKKVKNEGLDFGMWRKCFNDENIDLFNYDKIGLVNDSTILFDHKNFDKFMKWTDTTKSKYCSITESNEISHHLQSYFLIIKSEAIQKVYEYFKDKGILKKRDNIIKTYEIGLSKYLTENDIKIESFFKNKTDKNPTTLGYKKLMNNGIPVIKKKLLLNLFSENEMEFLESQKFKFGFDWVSKIKETIKKDTTSVEYLIDQL
jgi:hypothetical protein